MTKETPGLVVVADLEFAGGMQRLFDILASIAPVVSDPRVAVQLRAKNADNATFARIEAGARERLPGTHLILNGHPSLAARTGAWGLHWPEANIPLQRADRPRWQSAAVHSVTALRRAEAAGLDAVIFGPVFEPGSKKATATGLEALTKLARTARIPVLAIGGVTPGRVAPCLAAGAAGVAVVSGVLGSDDPRRAVGEYAEAIERAIRVEAEK